MIQFSIISLVSLALRLIIPIIVGVYVYRDATRRNMNAALWTLIAILAPSLIGFIIYLLVRGNYSDLRCPNCNETVKEEYIRCPKCGAKLRPTCPYCSTPIEPDWSVCPRCANPLGERETDITAPVKPRDKTLGKILIALILIPTLLIFGLILAFSLHTSEDGGTAMITMSVEDYFQEVDNAQIDSWLSDCTDNTKLYALRHDDKTEEGLKRVRYLIYLPQLGEEDAAEFDPQSGIFENILRIDYQSDPDSKENRLLLITCIGDECAKQKLRIYCDGSKMDCEITEVDYPLGMSDYSASK